MVFARRARAWEPVGRPLTDEAVHAARRRFLVALGAGGAAASLLAVAGRRRVEDALALDVEESAPLAGAPSAWRDAGRPLTPPRAVARFPNYFELGGEKRAVPARARRLATEPWAVVVDGLVERPERWTLERVLALGLEERVYRHRCVEAWALTVPWIGVPLRRLLEEARPLAAARYVAFESLDPVAAGLTPPEGFPFPYREGLTLAEAAHPLTLLAAGYYGRRLLPQNGAPLRLVVPWKYGFKGAKSLVRVTLCAERPPSFWNSVAPDEYGWTANVDPSVPHPRWSQAKERLLGTNDSVPTLPCNGYDVGSLYA